MAYCSQCGASIPDGAKFCPNCGAAVTAADPNAGSAPYGQEKSFYAENPNPQYSGDGNASFYGNDPYHSNANVPYGGGLRANIRKRDIATAIVLSIVTCGIYAIIWLYNIINDLKLQSYQKVFFSYLKYGPIARLDGTPADIDLRRMECVLALTGIAHPESMTEEIRRHCKVRHLAFADHHDFTKHDIATIRAAFEEIKAERKIILTTEKDAMRLRGITEDLPVYVLPIEVAFHKGKDLDFDQVINSSVRENISFLNKLNIWS